MVNCPSMFRGATFATLSVAVCGVALLSSCQRAAEPPAPEVRPVRTITVGKLDGRNEISFSGTVQAQTEANQAFRIDGRLVDRAVSVGDLVRPGQLLARLDPANEQSAVQAAQAQLNAARARLDEARSNYARQKGLVAERATARAIFEQAEAALRSAEAGVETAQSQLTQAQNRLSYTRLVSDAEGIVTATGAEPGEVVGAGRMVVQIAKQGGRDAVFDVSGRVRDVAPRNPKITVALATDRSVTATGRVREVAPRADPVTGTFRVRVALADPPPGMRLGATVVGSMVLPGVAQISIPSSALVRSERKPSVWLVDPKAMTVSARPVEIATVDASQVVVAAGLAPGDLVVTAGVQALRPGQKVRLLAQTAAATGGSKQ